MTQLARADLAGMTPEEIDEAETQGKFDLMLGRITADEAALIDRARDGSPLTRDDVERLAELKEHELIIQADQNGSITTEGNPQ